jgi:formylglycine-generating enzyme required for sulfatase activity
MKKKFKLFGIIALAVVIGFAIVACDSPGGGGGSKGGNNSSTSGTSYALTFDGNGNTGGTPQEKITEDKGKTVTIPGKGTLVKTGGSLTGWNTGATGSGDSYAEDDDYDKDKNATLYAQWTVAGEETVSDTGIKLAWIPEGTFKMGSPDSELNRNSVEDYRTANSGNVTVSGFWMGKYQVTQAEWKAVMGDEPSYFTGDNLPVEQVSWYDVIVFCNRLSIKEGLTPAYEVTGVTDWETVTAPSGSRNTTWDAATINPASDGYRLPTEAQWEYACRAGTTTAFNWGSNQITSDQANFNATDNLYNGSPAGEYRATTTAVGTFAGNAWNLHDMHGNVSEWCWDWYATSGSYNDAGGSTDPKGATSGDYRVHRGGSWRDLGGQTLRSAQRQVAEPWFRYYEIGFRLVRPL